MTSQDLIDKYRAGPGRLRKSLENLAAQKLDSVPGPGKWSIREVICHIADFEIVYADRMKRVIAVEEPSFFGSDPNQFAAGLSYAERNADEELALIHAVRAQMSRILGTLAEFDFDRIGHHTENGLMTLRQLLEAITAHLPHHVAFIDEKRRNMKT